MTTQTAGQALTAEIRKMCSLGPRTRWGRKGGTRTVRQDAIVQDIWHAIGEYRGTESERRTAIFDQAHTALCAYGKFIAGYRIDGALRFQIMSLTPWQFAGFLGEMVDSGCTNMGQFEEWFADRTREIWREMNAQHLRAAGELA